MLKLFTRCLTTATKNDKIMKKILKYQHKIKNLIIENKLQLTGYTYSYSFHDKSFHDKSFNDKSFNEKKYIKDEKEYIIKMNKFYNL